MLSFLFSECIVTQKTQLFFFFFWIGCAAWCGFPIMYSLLYYTTSLSTSRWVDYEGPFLSFPFLSFPFLSFPFLSAPYRTAEANVTHAIPVGGGNAPTHCWQQPIKRKRRRRKNAFYFERFDRKIHSLSPCWNDFTLRTPDRETRQIINKY